MPGNKNKRLPPELEVPACHTLARWLCAEAGRLRADDRHDLQAVVASKLARAEARTEKRATYWEPALFVRVGQQTTEVQALLRSWSNMPTRIIRHCPDGGANSRRYRVVLPFVLERACSEDENLLAEVEEAISYLRDQTWCRTERIVNSMRVIAGEATVFDTKENKQEGEE